MKQQVIWNPRKAKKKVSVKKNPAKKKPSAPQHKGPDIFGVHHADFGKNFGDAKSSPKRVKPVKRVRKSLGSVIHRAAQEAKAAREANEAKKEKFNLFKAEREKGLTASQALKAMKGEKVVVQKRAKRKASKRPLVSKSVATGGNKMAKKGRKSKKATKVTFAKAATQRLSPKKKGGYASIHKGTRFKVPTRGKGFLVYQRTNPVALGGFWDTGMDGKQLALVLGAGILAPFAIALMSRVPVLSKLPAIPTYGVPGAFILAGGVMNALAKQNPTVKMLGQAFVVIGAVRLGGALADQFTKSSGGVKGMMDGLLGEVEGEDVGEYGEDIAALPAGIGEEMQGVDFTPARLARPQPMHGEYGHGGNMAALPQGMQGVDFTRTNGTAPGRDGVNFGAPRDGVDFGGEYGEYAGSMG